MITRKSELDSRTVGSAIAPTLIRRMGRLDFESSARPIVAACDEAYAMPLSTMLRSLLESNGSARPLDVCVLTTDFSAGTKEKVLLSLPPHSATIHWIPIDVAQFKDFSQQYPAMAYARLLLPYIFPDNVTRLLYLDVDVLVLGRLDLLWHIDLEGAPVGAVVDTFSQDHAERLKLNEHAIASIGSAGDRTFSCEYFNSGVLLVDLPKWRQERVSERALEYLTKHPEALWPDQDALNVVCVGRWKHLDMRWNHQTHGLPGYAQMPLQRRPPIVHFAGKRKPWLATYLNLNAEFYDDFRSRTQFARGRLEKVGDAMLTFWLRSRCFLKQYKTVFLVYKYFTRSR